MGGFLIDLFSSRRVILELAKRDLKTRYLGSMLGIMWAFIQPSISILIYWFVFQVGFKSTPIDNFPFILWFMAAMVPWLYFSEALSSSTNSIAENSYLVKKVVFRVSVLPVIKIISSLFIHLFFIIVLFSMYAYYGFYPTLYSLQVIYYLFATIFLVLGLSWITSSLLIFLKDIGQFVSMVLNFLFWLTPIFWNLNIVDEKYVVFIKLNPVYYVVEGYRDTFIYQKWFWSHPVLTTYYWLFTGIVLILGVRVFKKLRPHFADVI